MKLFPLRAAKTLTLLFALLLISNWMISTYMEVKAAPETFRDPDSVPSVEAIVVPGASVYRSGKLSLVLLRRMDAALTLAHGRRDVKLVLSGYAVPNGYNETRAMREYAISKGFPTKNVLLDEEGRSTFLTLLDC